MEEDNNKTHNQYTNQHKMNLPQLNVQVNSQLRQGGLYDQQILELTFESDEIQPVMDRNQSAPQSKPQCQFNCFILENLVNLGEDDLRRRYEKDPFLKSGLKYIERKLKQNKPSTQCQSSRIYNENGKINYRNYKRLYYEKQSKMCQKVINILSQKKD